MQVRIMRVESGVILETFDLLPDELPRQGDYLQLKDTGHGVIVHHLVRVFENGEFVHCDVIV